MGSVLLQTRIMAVLETGSASAGQSLPDSSRIAAAADTLSENGVLCLALSPRAANGLTALEQLAARLPDDAELGLGAVLAPEDRKSVV